MTNPSSSQNIVMAAAEEVKVLSTWASAFGMRVQIALEEKCIKYDYQEENLPNKSPLLLQMNPVYKKIPVLIHNGKPVAESLIILHYIDEAWPSNDGNLLPPEPYDRASARFWADFIDKKAIHFNSFQLLDNFYDVVARIVRTKGEEQEQAKRELVEYLVLLEEALKKLAGGKPYFGGETFGFLDIAFLPFTSWFSAFESIGNCKIPLEEKCPNIDGWIKRCAQRDSVRKILPDPCKILEEARKWSAGQNE